MKYLILLLEQLQGRECSVNAFGCGERTIGPPYPRQPRRMEISAKACASATLRHRQEVAAYSSAVLCLTATLHATTWCVHSMRRALTLPRFDPRRKA
jgi:hypothetical protein